MQMHGAKLEDIKSMEEYRDFFNQPGEPNTDNEPINPDALEDLAKLQFEKNFKVNK